MARPISKNNDTRKLIQKWRIYTLTAVVLLLMALYDLSIVGGNNIRLYAKWANCGRWPVETVGNLAGEVPSYRYAKAAGLLLRGGVKYYCTPLEAEKAGYSASPNQYEFPNLNDSI